MSREKGRRRERGRERQREREREQGKKQLTTTGSYKNILKTSGQDRI